MQWNTNDLASAPDLAKTPNLATTNQPTPDNQAEGPTGPRTVDGKAISSMNALKHGLSITRHVVLKHEDLQEFNSLSTELHEIFAPQSARERLAVDEIAHCKWALRRFERAEAFALEFPTNTHSPEQPEVPAEHKLEFITALSDQPGKAHSAFIGIHTLLRYRGHWDRRHQRALAEFDRAQRARHAEARERRAEAKEQREAAKAQRQQLEEQRREELHKLKTAHLKARIDREIASTPPPKTHTAQSGQFVSLYTFPTPATPKNPAQNPQQEAHR